MFVTTRAVGEHLARDRLKRQQPGTRGVLSATSSVKRTIQNVPGLRVSKQASEGAREGGYNPFHLHVIKYMQIEKSGQLHLRALNGTKDAHQKWAHEGGRDNSHIDCDRHLTIKRGGGGVIIVVLRYLNSE